MTATKTKPTPKKRTGSKPAAAKTKATNAKKRLRPGELDGLVLAHMRLPAMKLPLTAGAIAKGIDRSSGAVANCRERLADDKQVRRAKRSSGHDLKVNTAK